jgi:hypothetical protein
MKEGGAAVHISVACNPFMGLDVFAEMAATTTCRTCGPSGL